MPNGIYEEIISCGGKLRVSALDWEIQYYFPGPDLRYNGEFVKIESSQILVYINAFEKNWDEFLKLKNAIPLGGEFTKTAELGMTVRIGGPYEGVCIKSYHMPIRTIEQLRLVIDGYRSTLTRAPRIQSILSTL